MTKEDIIKKHYEATFASPKYDKSVNKEMNKQYILPAMDEYAKQETLAFYNWCKGRISFYLQPGTSKEDWRKWVNSNTEERYNLYIQSKNVK